jgi:DNA polymerase III delta prime subunit
LLFTTWTLYPIYQWPWELNSRSYIPSFDKVNIYPLLESRPRLPFLEFGVAAKPTPSKDSSTANINENDPRPTSSQSGTQEPEPHILSDCNANVSNFSNEGAVALDEDPNESRRKRRRTDKIKTTEPTSIPSAGLSAWLGVSAPPPTLLPTDAPNDLDTNRSTLQLETPPAESLAHDAPQVSTLSKKSEPEPGTARPSSRQKILKLNSKGRFLSSPASSPPPDTQKRATGKRRRTRKEETKVVIIKYGLGTEGRTGNLINDILNGLVQRQPATHPVQPRKTKSQPRKPNHPFFNKNSTQNSGPSNLVDGQDPYKAPTQITAATLDRKRVVPASDISFSTIPRRVNKFPELVHPIWPPQGLVHVRDTYPAVGINDRACHMSQDKKKSKIAAIIVSDEENVILTGTAEARRIARLSTDEPQNNPAILRHPIRHVASGNVLQTAMERQMSWSSPNRQFHWSATSPPLAKLRLALLSSASANDCAKYETQLWSQRYAPTSADDVLQLGREPHLLRDWLRHLKITAVDTGTASKANTKPKSKRGREKKRKKRQKADKLDGFVVSSEEEASEMDNISGSDDELAGNVTTSTQKSVVRSGDTVSGQGAEKGQISNAILISGPAGCGKTASVHAVAKELDFEVFEINAGSRRNARDMLERVGDMTQNHLVHLLNESDSLIDSNKADAKQNKLRGFFKGPSAKPVKDADRPTFHPESETKRPREQKQCLILLEEADILFEEDRQFWTGVLTLISQSKRPIIITCNDESLIPTQEMSLHAILRYQKPSPDFVIDYLLLVAANEGHILKREAVTRLYQGSGLDLRKSLMDLNFWCQMGVGSDRSGLDWLLPAWPPESNLDQNGDRLRVLSLNTYERYMGWFNRDLLSTHSALDGETEVIRNSLHGWGVGLQESEDMAGKSKVELLPPLSVQSNSKIDQYDMLGCEADYYDMRSSLDILCSNFSTEMTNVTDIDTTPETIANQSAGRHRYIRTTAARRSQVKLPRQLPTSSDYIANRVFVA